MLLDEDFADPVTGECSGCVSQLDEREAGEDSQISSYAGRRDGKGERDWR